MNAPATHPATRPNPERRWRFVQPVPEAELFCEPSAEVESAFRRLPALFAPRGRDPFRLVRELLVTPYAYFAGSDVDLQIYLIDVFHTRPFTRAAHVVGLPLVNIAIAAGLTELFGPWATLAWAVALGLSSTATIASTRLVGWWLATLVLTAAVCLAGVGLSAAVQPSGLFGFWLASAWLVACGHLIEELPPRVGDPLRWKPIPEFVLGPPHRRNPPHTVLLRLLRLAPGPFVGLFNETCSAPRLMPFFLLRVLLALGYAPALKARFDDRRDRAWASGNPALDYIGIGGGTALQLDLSSPEVHESERTA